MLRGEAQLDDLVVTWAVPISRPEAAGGLEYLPSCDGERVSRTVEFVVEEGTTTPDDGRYDAFFGDVRVRIARDRVTVYGDGARFEVSARGVLGTVGARATLAATVAVHALAAHHALVHVHAAVFRLGERTFLAPGGSGSGKTSLALAMARAGGELLTDDLTYVAPDGRAWPVRRPPHVTSTTLAAHGDLEVLGPVRDGLLPKTLVRAPTPGPASPSLVDFVVVPVIDSGPTRIEPLDGGAVFPILLASSAFAMLDASPERDAQLDTLARLAELPAARLLAGPDALAEPRRLADVVRRWSDTLTARGR